MSFNKIPQGPHYAIITQDSITIPSDERSRTNPGHGYPEHTQEVIRYESFLDRDAWVKKIKEYSAAVWGKDFRAFEVKPATIKTSINVEIS